MRTAILSALAILLVLAVPAALRAQGGCDASKAPVVFVHGFLASGDTWTTQIQRFASNGHCQDRYFAFDWNSLAAAGADALLDKFIDSVRNVTGAAKVHLVGHSAGGGRGYSYLSDPTRAAKVISYAHVGSNVQTGPAGPAGSIPTLNVWSTGDKVVAGADIPGATNVKLTGLDHYQAATSASTFAAMYEFFYGTAPATTKVTPGTTITIGGRCLSLGENNPATGAMIEAFLSGPSGKPVGGPIGSFTVGANGHWGPVSVEPGKRYLFKVTSSSPSFRNVIYYYEPFVRDNPTVYLRTFPPPFSLAGILLSSIPNNDDQSVISIFTSTQAVLHGRDQLSMEGYDLAYASLATEAASMIALFCYDNGADGKGNAESISTFAAFPFLRGADIPIPAGTDKTWTIQFNGSSLPVHSWRSKSDGVVIAVFNEPQSTSSTDPAPGARGALELRPNPANGELWVRLPGTSLAPADISLLDTQGRNLSVPTTLESGDRLRLDTSSLPMGTYLCSVRTPLGPVTSPVVIAR